MLFGQFTRSAAQVRVRKYDEGYQMTCNETYQGNYRCTENSDGKHHCINKNKDHKGACICFCALAFSNKLG